MSAFENIMKKVATPVVQGVIKFNQSRMKAPDGPHPFLTGIHTPLEGETTLHGNEVNVTGQIPLELDGRYIRIGPNPISEQNPALYHWFMGDGMVHGIKIKDGKVDWYRNRWIRTTSVSKALGEEPAPGPRSPVIDIVNTNVLGHAGDTWALVEGGGRPVRIDENLETIAHDDFSGTLNHAYTAHPHTDPESGEMHSICYDATNLKQISHVIIGTDGKVRKEEMIDVENAPMIHDCMITKNYVLILDLPVTFFMKKLLAGKIPYAWNPDHQARVGLMPKEGTQDDIIWCNLDEPAYVFHPFNAYEREDGVVELDVCAHNRMFEEHSAGPESDRSPFERWTCDPAAKTVARKVVDKTSQEFPRCDERFMGRPYRYAFAVSRAQMENGAHVAQLIKHDLETGARELHDFGPDMVPSEFVFVPRNADADEFDGWVMGYVLDAKADTTDLVIIDAGNFAAEPVARIHVPHRIPPGFHGNWVPASVA